LANDYAQENVANLSGDTRSILNLYRALIELRKATPELVAGSYAPVAMIGDLLAYRREYAGNALLAFSGKILLFSYLDRSGETASDGPDLRGNEGLIIRLR
jgi:alpha-glucosidase